MVFEGSVGAADLERPRPLDARDLYRIGSVTKIYMAALVLQLEMLLRMRSGLPDYLGRLFGHPPDLSALDRCWSPEELVRLALAADDCKSPGTAYRYSNTDYILLGLIVERATGERVEAQLWRRIFKPLGLADTVFPTADPYLRGQHATGHVRDTHRGQVDADRIDRRRERDRRGPVGRSRQDSLLFHPGRRHESQSAGRRIRSSPRRGAAAVDLYRIYHTLELWDWFHQIDHREPLSELTDPVVTTPHRKPSLSHIRFVHNGSCQVARAESRSPLGHYPDAARELVRCGRRRRHESTMCLFIA